MSFRYMRLLLMFDMPQDTADDRKEYRKFRKYLLGEGFIMHQYSGYTKILLNGTASKLMLERLKQNKPKAGLITILSVTENQFSKMIYLSGEQDISPGNTANRIIFLGDDDAI